MHLEELSQSAPKMKWNKVQLNELFCNYKIS